MTSACSTTVCACLAVVICLLSTGANGQLTVTGVETGSPWTYGENQSLSCVHNIPLSGTTDRVTWLFTSDTLTDVYVYDSADIQTIDPAFTGRVTAAANDLNHTITLLEAKVTDQGTYTCVILDTAPDPDNEAARGTADVTVQYYDNSAPLVLTSGGETFEHTATNCSEAATKQDILDLAPVLFEATCSKSNLFPAATLTFTITDHAGTQTDFTDEAQTDTPDATTGLITSTKTISINATEYGSIFTLECTMEHPALTQNNVVCASYNARDPGGCISGPCQNNGDCEPNGDSFTCNCTADWTGNTCSLEVDACESAPCQHDGNCTDGVGTYTCQCDPCYIGDSCEEKAEDFCINRPCENAGACTDTCTGYLCDCLPGTFGTTCQIECYSISNITMNVTVELGEPITLWAEISDPDNHEVWWTKKGDQAKIGSGALHTIARARPESAGEYYIHSTDMSNNCTDRDTAMVFVIYDYNDTAPAKESHDLKEGDDLDLECTARATPTPYLRWDFVHSALGGNSTSGSENTDPVTVGNATQNSNTLRLTSVTEEDAGVYTCKVVLASLLEFDKKIVTVTVDSEDGGLKDWHIALIVVGAVLFVVIVVIIIIIIVLKCCDDCCECCTCCNDCAPKICPGDRSEDIDDDVEKRPYDRSPAHKKQADSYYNESITKETKAPKETKDHLTVDKPKSRRNSGYNEDHNEGRRLPSPPPNTRGGTLPPLETTKPKKKKKKVRKQPEDEEED